MWSFIFSAAGLNQLRGMLMQIITYLFFYLVPLTKFTLTAVLTAQFTSPHHQTLAGEGKPPPYGK